MNTEIITINVTQAHIDKAIAWRNKPKVERFYEKNNCNCPIALALTDTLQTPCEWGYIVGWIIHPEKGIIATPTYEEQVKDFVLDYDGRRIVNPFTFTITEKT